MHIDKPYASNHPPKKISRTLSSAGPLEGRPGSQASPTGPPLGVLLPQLQEMLESVTLQQEALREMVAAVSDADRGRMAALNAFIGERRPYPRASREQLERLRAEVGELREENARLRDRLRAAGASTSDAPSQRTTSES